MKMSEKIQFQFYVGESDMLKIRRSANEAGVSASRYILSRVLNAGGNIRKIPKRGRMSSRLAFQCTRGESYVIRSRAEEHGMTSSGYIRGILLEES